MAEAKFDDLIRRQDVLREREDAVRVARADRDQAVRDLVASGVTAYRIAQVLGLSRQAVLKIARS